MRPVLFGRSDRLLRVRPGVDIMSDLGPRVLSGIVMVALALGSLWIGGRWFVAFWLIASAAIFWEWIGLAGSRRRTLVAAVGAGALAIAASLASNASAEFAVLALVAGALIVGVLERAGRPVWAACGLLYAGALIVSVASLRVSLFGGFQAILWLFAVVWGTDILAYFGGRMIGGPKLWPRVSPSKTWSGFITGVTGGAAAGAVALALTMPQGMQSYIAFALLGLAAGAISQGGDLLESSIKRHFGVKDSSHLIPGHGGFMDRLDGFVAACAVAALLGLARGGSINPATGLLIW